MALEREYDVVVIGSGPAGGVVAPKCRSAGRTVALVESRQFGGTCPNRGCNPKKVLVAAAEIIHRTQSMREKGIWGAVTIDWPELMRFKKSFTDPVSENKRNSFQNAGIDVYQGEARFLDEHSIRANEHVLTGKHLVVASGMITRKLNIEGEHLLVDSEGFLELEQLPDSIIFIGGGYIALEFAHIAALAGAKVTILEMKNTVLPGFDQDMVRLLVEASKEMGIEIHTNVQVQSLSREDDLVKVYGGSGGQTEFQASLVVNAAGRIPDVGPLKLEQGHIEASPQGIAVNEYLQSISNDSVYAAGDVAASPFPLTPVAAMEGGIVAENILRGNTVKADYAGVPQVVFTIPPLASTGMLEDQARELGIVYESRFYETSSWFSSRRIGLKYSGAKVLIAKHSRRILGAHLFGHNADEVINIFSMAIRGNLTAHNLERMLWTYPSSTYEINYML
ncbi:MAG: NAD(P)/FAD-dependent oxidoreductase [Candidatus Abyssobacteria bacterium SURF_5]|uniref:NAD(P)/FAD-dependent oxidoreductase n=1 Tax=Abyssobacteria bacterium (strain SURF_5) TaxID=2093360 RepID=A0A3A4NZ68_ABYX5|nr:MAG: NAD(P)/FAD-dependent oxidoreductase [Candidatus Abyssubacteria bacterium SURF_5]